MYRYFCPFSILIPRTLFSFPMQANPHRCPSAISVKSIAIVASLIFPIIFCVRVLRASLKVEDFNAFRVSEPGCADKDHAWSVGL